MEPSSELDRIQYEHPKVVDSLKQGWVLSYQAIAVVAALFAAMEASLITLAKTPEPESHSPLRFSSQPYQNAVLGLAYVALILSVGAIISALKLVDALGQMHYWNAVDRTNPKPNWQLLGPNTLMKTYGVKGSLRLLMWHCVYSLIVGALCILAQLIMYICLHEAAPVIAAASVATAVGAIPIFIILFSL
ncbi:hypothetical protein M407DRAFT_19686 [Tulasnella calospora MUT 4182]|uniref:Uncharacterized protein n=1 Tax=Tulasnella calospora MUT 4182 TaxID=1051891 RepID=A0A0C3LBQ3_9AGAM|nr:hypothetical protein M407DRAFT_19686 [Tulasnella calospora MUT 4182]